MRPSSDAGYERPGGKSVRVSGALPGHKRLQNHHQEGVNFIFIWDFVASTVMDNLIDWFYGQVVGFLGNFFAEMGNMGVELFDLEWVQAIILFFSQLAWALFGVSLVVSAFEFGIEYSSGRGNLQQTAINALKGFMAVSLFTTVPVQLYALSVSLQGTFATGLTGYGNSIGTVGEAIIADLQSVDSLTDMAGQTLDFGLSVLTSPFMLLFCIILMSASDYVLVPVQADYLAAEDMTELIGTVRSIQRQINPRLKIGGVFLTMANETTFRKDIVNSVKSNFGRHLPVLDTVIPATVRLAEVSTADKSIFQHEPRGRAADAYRRLTKEVLDIGSKERSRTSLVLLGGGVFYFIKRRR